MEAELGLARAAFGNNFGDGVAGDAAADTAVHDGTSKSAFLGGKKLFWCHRMLSFLWVGVVESWDCSLNYFVQ